MLLLQFTSEASSPIDSIQRMTLAQFKALLHAAKVTAPPFPVEQLDELFTTVLGTPGAQARYLLPSMSAWSCSLNVAGSCLLFIATDHANLFAVRQSASMFDQYFPFNPYHGTRQPVLPQLPVIC